MTVTDEQTTEAPAEETTETASEGSRKREHDFTKVRPFHEEIASFINAHPKYLEAELGNITPNQVKAVLLLRTDFANTPEQVAEREAKKAAAEAEKKLYEGLTDDQIKAAKAVKKAEEAEARLLKRAAEARANAERLRTEASASGSDLAAAVAAQQGESADEGDEDTSRRRGLGRKRG